MSLTPVTIYQRSEPVSPREDQLYHDSIAGITVLAKALREEGVLTDHEIIAATTRTLQQMAANATYLANQMGVELD
jgi:hypothetical protein